MGTFHRKPRLSRYVYPNEMDAVFDDLAAVDQGRMVLYRVLCGAELCYLTTLTPKTFTLKRIQRQFGGGRYCVKAIRNGVLVKQRRFAIEGEPILGKAGRISASTAGSVVASIVDKLAADLRALRKDLEAVQERQEELQRVVEVLVSKDRRSRLAMRTRRRL